MATAARPPPPQPTASSTAPPPPHLVSLKVLRATRPALVPAEPLVHDYAPPTSPSHHQPRAQPPGGTLSLPTSFANIYLGETFNAVLSLSNDLVPPSTISSSSSTPPSAHTALAPVLHVEMHTNLGAPASAPVKHLLAHVDPSAAAGPGPGPGPLASLAPGAALPALVVAHELKELGAHALVCTVSYGVEVPGPAPDGEGEGGTRVVTRSFRKVYKFAVQNPLSVRTKAHAPSPSLCPSSALSPLERNTVFLEVQVTNQCGGEEAGMRFERMRFVPLGGWRVVGDEDAVRGEEAEGEDEGARPRAAEPLAPGAVRQFLFVLDRAPPPPSSSSSSLDAPEPEPEPEPAPGASQGLGRLDIVWRTAHGELGRLQSSTLGRRVPPRLGSGVGLGGGLEPGAAHEEEERERGAPSTEGLAFELVVDEVRPAGAGSGVARSGSTSEAPPPQFVVDEPFAVQLRLRVRSTTSSPRRRRVRLAAQHVEWHAPALGPLPSSSSSTSSSFALASAPTATLSAATAASAPPHPHRSSHAPHPSSSALPLPLPLPGALPPPLPRPTAPHPHAPNAPQQQQHGRRAPTLRGVRLPLAVPSRAPAPAPSPSPSPSPSHAPSPSQGVVRLGAGLVDLGAVELEPAPGGGGGGGAGRWHDVGWAWRFVPRVEGLVRVGGLRVLLLESGEGEEGEGEGERERKGEGQSARGEERVARTVLELGTFAEVWVEA